MKTDELRFLKLQNPSKFKKQKAKEAAKYFVISKFQSLEETRIQFRILLSFYHYHYIFLINILQYYFTNGILKALSRISGGIVGIIILSNTKK